MNKLTCLLILLYSSTVLAQTDNFKHSSSWNTITIKANLNDKLFLKNEINFRRTNFLRDWEQLVLRPSVEYQFNDGITTATGYTFIQNYTYADFSAPIDTKENNLWQQVLLKQDFGGFEISHRIRFEERFRETVAFSNAAPILSGTDYSSRLRYRFIVAIPVLKKQGITALAYDEVFLDFENSLQPKKLDQNWMFVGLRFRESEHITITSGYHNIYVPRENSSITNHIWETSLIYSL